MPRLCDSLLSFRLIIIGSGVALLFGLTWRHLFAPSEGIVLSDYSREVNTSKWPRHPYVDSLILGSSSRLDFSKRLEAWKKAPLRAAEGRDGWTVWNEETCPSHRVYANRNVGHYSSAWRQWQAMGQEYLIGLRNDMISYIEGAMRFGTLQFRYCEGRGIVMTAGNGDTYLRALVSIRFLRNRLKSTLPIEVFSFSAELDAMPPSLSQQFLDLRATLRAIPEPPRPDSDRAVPKKRFRIKSQAILHSSFEEVLYIDSDNVPVANGLKLEAEGTKLSIWEGKGFKNFGVVFWPDLWKTSPENPIFQVLGVQCRDEWEVDTGQILINKGRHLDVLLLVDWMLQRPEVFFAFSDGDKDLFRFALLALRKRWAVPGRYVGLAGSRHDTPTGFRGHSMIQFDEAARPAFVHMSVLKLSDGWRRGSVWTKVKTVVNPSGIEYSGTVSSDMLANAQHDGSSLGVRNVAATKILRQRAISERTLRPRLHGGVQYPLALDMIYLDPRPDDEAFANNRYPPPKVTARLDLSWENPIKVLDWGSFGELEGFEDAFFLEGGQTTMNWTIEEIAK